MTARKLLLALALATCSALVFTPHIAHAQSTTTGAIQGVVTDKKTTEKLAGVTVVVTSPSLAQSQSVITDDQGFYKITELPPGVYLVEFFYADIHLQLSGVNVGVSKTTPLYQQIDQSQAGGEVVKVEAKVPTIDPTTTTQGITIDKNYIKNIPVPGRTFESVLGAAAGSQNDGVGVSFSGSSSLENQYYVDGVNTTGLTYGTVGSPIINDFIEEIEVMTGGYQAEFGRATGGVVNVVTKSGSNEVKGSIFGNWQPGTLTAAAKLSPENATSIDFKNDLNYDADFGFEIGGPIIKDKLWYFVGFAPRFVQYDATRYTKSETDCRVVADPANGIPQGDIPGLSICDPKKYQDGVPDVDPKTGFFITDPLDQEVRSATTRTYNVLTKINYALTPEHQGQIAFEALPSSSRSPNLLGPASLGQDASELVTDLSAKWTSKFNDNKTEVEAIIGWHRDDVTSDAIDRSLDTQPLQSLVNGDLYPWGKGFMSESAKTLAGCYDDLNPNSTTDKYPLIRNCPMDVRPYYVGGPGTITRDTEERRAAQLRITERVKAAGNHEIKAGIDVEDNLHQLGRLFSGGQFITNFINSAVYQDRWVQIGGRVPAMGDTNPDPTFFNKVCSTPNPEGSGGPGGGSSLDFYCAYLNGVPGSRGSTVYGNTINWAAYLRDSWQIRPNLYLNLGIRYEEQRLRYASFLQNTTDPLTGDHHGTDAMDLTGMWAPRLGVTYDWTKEGRSKVYANWGRFFESIPMDINDRSLGGEVTDRQIYTANNANCGMSDPRFGNPPNYAINGANCGAMGQKPDLGEQLLGGLGELIAPGIQAQYMDELVAGVEYELLDDLKIGISYQNRSLGRVIEDVSTDGANTYIIANPGEWSQAQQNAFQKRIDMTDDPALKAHLQHELNLFEGIRIFDKPRRDYNALQFTLTRRFSKKLYVQGSYTYSRTEGNYGGLVSYENGQIDPNISSQYDLIELLANRIGPLSLDRPHYIKLDGYYTFDFKKAGHLTIGLRFRALSGTPENALAAHYLYGPNESFLLPRGSLGRSDFDHGLDARIIYGRDLPRGMALEAFTDFYNLYNRQGTFYVDETYGPQVSIGKGAQIQNANPIAGGTYDDLIWVKTINEKSVETHTPLGRNPNFLNTIARYAPAYIRFGVRLTF
jgi:outer membrane receptor protein involved in Fe transport